MLFREENSDVVSGENSELKEKKEKNNDVSFSALDALEQDNDDNIPVEEKQ